MNGTGEPVGEGEGHGDRGGAAESGEAESWEDGDDDIAEGEEA